MTNCRSQAVSSTFPNGGCGETRQRMWEALGSAANFVATALRQRRITSAAMPGFLGTKAGSGEMRSGIGA